jgi:hypothetical protein
MLGARKSAALSGSSRSRRGGTAGRARNWPGLPVFVTISRAERAWPRGAAA